MTVLNVNDVIYLHRMIYSETGGAEGVRDLGLLESAVSAPFASFGETELYPTLSKKAARLGYALISNHAFVDGNKRIGVLSMLTFLSLNGAELSATDSDITELGLKVASGEWKYGELLSWIEKFTA